MSKYEWERGTIKIPAKEWSGFRKGLLEAWNDKQNETLSDAKLAHAKLKYAARGKRGFIKRHEAMRDALHRYCDFRKQTWGWEPLSDEARERFNELDRLLLVCDPKSPGMLDRTKLQTPKKSDLDLKPVSKDADIMLPDASVHFRNKTRTVEWDVGENNHAVENAHEHWFAKRLFRAIKRITWTWGSGGKIVGNDEYNRDEGGQWEGGGGSYVNFEFSPEAQKRERRVSLASRSAYRDLGYGQRW